MTTPCTDATNWVPNPSVEVDTTGWGAFGTGTTIARDTTQSAPDGGVASLRVDFAAAGNKQAFITPPIAVTAGESVTVSVNVKVGTSPNGVRLQVNNQTNTVVLCTTASTTSTTWTRLTCTFTVPASGTTSLNIFVGAPNATAGDVFWVDNAIVLRSGTFDSYFDGSTADTGYCLYEWTGAAHNSPSVRTGTLPPPPPPPPPPEPVPMAIPTASCPCGAGWRVEAAYALDGVPHSVWPVVTLECQTMLNKGGSGTFVMTPRDVANLRHIWPQMTTVWVTYYGRFVWAGIVKDVQIDTGTIKVGCQSLDAYLAARTVRQTLVYTATEQTQIGASLVEYARLNNGIPLYGAAIPSTRKRDRTYQAYDRPWIAELIENLTATINGPDWVLDGRRDGGMWTGTMTFWDHLGADRGAVVKSGTHALEYGLDVTGDGQATVVDAIGAGDESARLIATAGPDVSPYPQFDAKPDFSTVTSMATLQQQADGYLDAYRESIATPRLSLFGREALFGQDIRLGDQIAVDLCVGGLGYKGRPRVVGETWRASAGDPTKRELILQPTQRPSDTMFDLPPCGGCADC